MLKIYSLILFFLFVSGAEAGINSPGGFIADEDAPGGGIGTPLPGGYMRGGGGGAGAYGLGLSAGGVNNYGAGINPVSNNYGAGINPVSNNLGLAANKPNMSAEQLNPLLTKSCPFKKEVKGISDILESTKNQLAMLANDTSCPSVASAARVMNQTLSTSISNKFGTQGDSQNFYNPIGVSSIGPECTSNYEQNLTFDYNLALKMGGTNMNFLPSSYQKCAASSEFNKCATDTYIANLAYMGSKCPEDVMKKSREQRNSQFGQVIKDLSDNFDALIRNSGSCSETTVSQTVLQTTLNTMTAFSALAPSMGMTGIGLSMVGRMVGSLFDNLFDQNSPSKLLGAIKKEEEMENLNCLNYMLQRESLQCEKLVISESPIAVDLSVVGSCYDYYYGQSSFSITEFINSLSKIKNQANMTFSPSNGGSNKNFDALFRSMNKTIADPLDENKKIKFSDYLEKVSKNLMENGELDSIANGQILTGYLLAYKNLDLAISSGMPSSNPKAFQEAMENFKSKSKMLANDSGGNVFESAIEKYWENMGQSSAFAQIKNFGRLRSDLQYGLEATAELYRGIQSLESSGGAQRKLDVAHTSFVNAFKDKFKTRLTTLEKTLTMNKSKQDRADTMMDLVPLVQSCSLNAGMFYFKESSDELKSRNNIVSAIPADYQKACSRFSCYMKIFDPTNIEKEDQRAQAFRSHQCSLIVKYPQILDNVSKEFREKGTICGK